VPRATPLSRRLSPTLVVSPASEHNAILQSVLSATWNEGNRLARQRLLASSGAVALPFQAPSHWVAAGARAVRSPPMSRSTPVTNLAPAPRRGRVQMLARVTVPAPASAAAKRLLGSAGCSVASSPPCTSHRSHRRLTSPSSGRAKGCALVPPLKSNVGRLKRGSGRHLCASGV
jgi:hypothetical protein